MTNREKYADEIIDIALSREKIAVDKKNKISTCRELGCHNCVFKEENGSCVSLVKEWSEQEYVEPPVDWSNVAVDTKILVSDDNFNWYRRYFAEYKDGKVYAWINGKTSWSTNYESKTHCKYSKLAEQEDK